MELEQKIKQRSARIGIIGLGYVGLPLACAFAEAGFAVTGFEVDSSKVKKVLAGQSYINDIADSSVKKLVRAKTLHASTNFDSLKQMDAVIICVPTPLRKTKDPDISYISDATKEIARRLHKGQLIVLESTTYPGTTKEFVLPLLEAKGLSVGKDFYLAFSPERIDPGNKQFNVRNTPKVVGGMTARCTHLATKLYGSVIQQIVPVSSTDSAEMVKLLENTFRAVNIGLVNEIALICDRLNLNVWEVIEAASTKPYGYMTFLPGPGLGGHCIPVDPHYLSWKMKSLNFSARFIELAGEVNSHMPDFVVQKVVSGLNKAGKAVQGSRLLVLGVAYKADVSDTRESPALDILHLLGELGAKVYFHDPFVKTVRVSDHSMKGIALTAKALAGMDAVILTTAHKAFDPAFLLKHSKLFVDTRNITRGLSSTHLLRL